MEQQIAKINSMISEKAVEAKSGDAPNMQDLEAEITSFIMAIKNLSEVEVSQYSEIINIWSVQIRDISEDLIKTKANLQQGINNAQNQTKAASAYSSTSALNNNDS